MMKRIIKTVMEWAIPGLIIIILVFMLLNMLKAMRQHSTIVDANTARKAEKPIPVSTFVAEVAPIQPVVVGSCTTKPKNVIELASAIRDIQVTKKHQNVGSYVYTGEPLLELDDRQIATRISRAKDQIEWLQQEIYERERLVDYYRENRASGQSLEIDYRRAVIDLIKAQGEFAVADEELTVAQVEQEKTRVFSPVTGRIDAVAEVGEVTRNNMTLATLTVVDPMLADCLFDTADYSYLLKYKNEGEIVLKGLDGKRYAANFLQESPDGNVTDNLNWTFQIDNSNLEVQTNMTGFIRFVNEESALRIPSVALLNQFEQTAQVFVVDNNTATLTNVSTGIRAGGFVVITDGLDEGDQVVVAGQLDLINNDQVNVLDPTEVTFTYGQ